MSNLFTGIIGESGSGKSSLETAYLYDAYLKGVKVFANYQLYFPFTYMTFQEMIELPEEIEGGILGMDELQKGADSYEFFSKPSKKLTTFVSEFRKREFRGIYTVPRFRWVALRLREITGQFILTEDIDKNKPSHTRENCDAKFHLTYLDDDLEIINERDFDGKPFQHLYNDKFIIRGDERDKSALNGHKK